MTSYITIHYKDKIITPKLWNILVRNGYLTLSDVPFSVARIDLGRLFVNVLNENFAMHRGVGDAKIKEAMALLWENRPITIRGIMK